MEEDGSETGMVEGFLSLPPPSSFLPSLIHSPSTVTVTHFLQPSPLFSLPFSSFLPSLLLLLLLFTSSSFFFFSIDAD